MPSSTEIANAWSKWYKYASALRRLIYIRKLITKLRYYDIDYDDYDGEPDDDTQDRYNDEGSHVVNGVGFQTKSVFDSTRVIVDEESQHIQNPWKNNHKSPRNAYKESMQNLDYYKEVFSTFYCSEQNKMLLSNVSEQQGPEQTAVYSRELAQSAAACCPNGCFEGRLRRSGIDDLVLEERDAIIKVHDAYDEWESARTRAAAGSEVSSTLEEKIKDDRDDEEREGKDEIENNLSGIEPPSSSLPEFKKFEENRPPPLQIKRKDSVRLNQISNSPSAEENSVFGPLVDLTGSGLRSRTTTQSSNEINDTERTRWERVSSIVNQDEWQGVHKMQTRRELHSGRWHMMTFDQMWQYLKESGRRFTKWFFDRKVKVIDEYTRESTYAVVTFTSRHAAIEARKCLLVSKTLFSGRIAYCSYHLCGVCDEYIQP